MDNMLTPQVRPQGEKGAWYAPARDLTVYLPQAISAALRRFDETPDPYAIWDGDPKDLEEQLCKAAEALAVFCGESCVIHAASFMAAWEKAGLSSVEAKTRVIIMTAIAEELLAAFWVGIRGATTTNESGNLEILQYDPKAVRAETDKCIQLLRIPKWKRKLRAWREWLIGKLRGGAQ